MQAQSMTSPGLEPGISGSGGRRLIHQANGPSGMRSDAIKICGWALVRMTTETQMR